MDYSYKRLMVSIRKSILEIIPTIGTGNVWLNKQLLRIPFIKNLIKRRWGRKIENEINSAQLKTNEGFVVTVVVHVTIG